MCRWLATSSRLAVQTMGLPAEGSILARTAGSVRRETKVVRDVDLVVVGWTPSPGDATKDVVFIDGGDKKQTWSVSGVQVDLYLTTPEHFGAALLYATGPKIFNVRMRRRAKILGWKLNRDGLWDGDELLEGASEKDIFQRLNMDYIRPENR